ncbi:MAG TPA: sodium:solute symporter [Bacteroidota bacterium]|nr:sodium:solute symporter [Bacteroidota bacterium]
MRTSDWIVLALTLASIVGYGIYKGRGSRNLSGYLLADRQMRWYTVALSIMATQASAITFTSTPGQAFVDGMRFVQYYFGIPIAMVILSVTAVPIFHKLRVFTAYEYLEHRFDVKTRTLTSILFMVSRGLGAGMSIYAPSLVLSVMLGIDIRLTSTIIGGAIIIYTTSGGIKAVNWTDFQQLLIVMGGMVFAFIMTIVLLPSDISFSDALLVAGASGRLNVIDFSFDLGNRYNFWSGIIGGMFVALAYFGTDQSQVQRYLTGQSVTQSRLGLMFNGLAKVPMQFFILMIGVMVFVFYQFTAPPLFFNPVETDRIKSSQLKSEYEVLEERYRIANDAKAGQIREYLETRERGSASDVAAQKEGLMDAEREVQSLRASAADLLKANNADTNDTNYVFLSFVVTYLPAGLVGLIFACIFSASMSSASGELSALATTSVVDVYRRHLKTAKDEKHYLLVSRFAMAGWGVYGILFAQLASGLGSLVEAVNILGSLFYGTMLGVFLIAFYMKWISGTPVFIGAVVSEIVIFALFLCERLGLFTLSWLWYPVAGCSIVILVAVMFQSAVSKTPTHEHHD